MLLCTVLIRYIFYTNYKSPQFLSSVECRRIILCDREIRQSYLLCISTSAGLAGGSPRQQQVADRAASVSSQLSKIIPCPVHSGHSVHHSVHHARGLVRRSGV